MAKTPGPDQAASWVIAAAACVINTLLSGIARGAAIFYIALIEVHGVTRYEANMPFTLRNVTRNLAGPLVGILGQKFGVRSITLVGGFFATLGVALCCVAPNVVYVSIFWGVFHGFGVALANTLFQVTVNQYFLKYRATAAGIALSGACVGSFFFPAMLEYFVNTYGLNGAFLLTSGLILHVIPAAILLTEPPWLKKSKKKSIKSEENGKSEIVVNVEHRAAVKVETEPIDSSDVNKEFGTTKSDQNPRDDVVTEHEKSSDVKPVTNSESESVGYKISILDVRDSFEDKVQGGTLTTRDARTVSMSELSVIMPMNMHRTSNAKNSTIVQSLLKVCRNPMFYMISFSLATFAILFDPLMTVIMDYINDKGLDERVGKYLISVLSVGDLIGRMCFGWVTDKEFMTVGRFMVFNQLLQGVAFLVLPLFYTFEVLMGLVVIYGVAAGTEIVMFPILVAKYLPNDQSMAIGCIAFFGGLVSFVVPPLIGHFRDNAGSYDGMFYITGSVEVFAALIWLFEPCLSKFCTDKSPSQLDGSLRR